MELLKESTLSRKIREMIYDGYGNTKSKAEGARYIKCSKCNRAWNISTKLKVITERYICPDCALKAKTKAR